MEEPDPQLVAAARSGDLDAFERLVRRYQGDVWRLCAHLTGDPTLADDAAQEAFVRAFRFLRRYRGDARFTTWLFSIARNCAMDELRRVWRRRRVVDRASGEVPQTGRDIGLALEVRDALADLPLQLREPVVLIDMLGTGYREVARMLNVPEGTVKSRVHRARALLAAALGAEAEEAGGES